MASNPEIKRFYHSRQWKKISRAYMQSQNYVCERCGSVGTICHHRHYITPKNINDFSLSLEFKNLECLCMNCHNKEHFSHQSKCEREVIFDADGNAVNVVEASDEIPPLSENFL